MVLSLAGIEPPEYLQGRAFLGKYASITKRNTFLPLSLVSMKSTIGSVRSAMTDFVIFEII